MPIRARAILDRAADPCRPAMGAQMPAAVISRIAAVLFVAASALGGTAAAQDVNALPPPAHITHVEGEGTLDREGQVEPVAVNMPIVPGDRLRTTSARVE